MTYNEGKILSNKVNQSVNQSIYPDFKHKK